MRKGLWTAQFSLEAKASLLRCPSISVAIPLRLRSLAAAISAKPLGSVQAILESQLPLLIVKAINKLHPEYQSSGPWTLPADYECGRRQNTLSHRTQEQYYQSASSIFGGRNHGTAITSRNRSPTV
jgi:hypothetical protein